MSLVFQAIAVLLGVVVVAFAGMALAAGYRRVAIVLSADMFNQIAVRNIVDPVQSQTSFVAEYFGNLETARRWLAQPEG